MSWEQILAEQEQIRKRKVAEIIERLAEASFEKVEIIERVLDL